MPLSEYGGVLGVKRAGHLLRRATFGATKAQIDAFASLTPAQAIPLLFNQTLPDPSLPIDPETGLEWVTGTTPPVSEEFDLERYFMGWFVGQMLSADVDTNTALAYSAREKMVFFLHTHFTTIKSKVGSSRALYFQNQLLRQFAFDGNNPLPEVNFKELTVKISIDNAMLRLLDGNLNVKGSPNENYARELIELYSIGRGLEGSLPTGLPQGDYYLYTEDDVQAAARVLSGWDFDGEFTTVDEDTEIPRGRIKGNVLNASAHDNAVKNFSARFNNAVIQADPLLLNGTQPTEESALDEIRQLIDLIYSKRETAKNICWKIYRFFVYAPHETYASGNLVATIDQNIIEQMADTFIANNYKIQPVIENLLRSEHFYDSGNSAFIDDNFGGIIKSPLDLIIGTLRMFNFQVPSLTTNTSSFYEVTTTIVNKVEDLGMNFFEPYDVAGYEAYHQFPIFHRAWITPNSLARRYEFIRNIFNSTNPNVLTLDALEFISTNFNAEAPDVDELVKAIANYFLPVSENLSLAAPDANAELTYDRLRYFKVRFLDSFDETYWTTRWNSGAGDLREQLELLFNAVLQSPEYQLQ